jgi:hypothetical protein
MMQTLDSDKRITPVDVPMIGQVALCLNIMRVTPYYMGRYKLQDGVIVSLLTYYSEHVGAHGKMSGRKSLCTGSGLKSGVW